MKKTTKNLVISWYKNEMNLGESQMSYADVPHKDVAIKVAAQEHSVSALQVIRSFFCAKYPFILKKQNNLSIILLGNRELVFVLSRAKRLPNSNMSGQKSRRLPWLPVTTL